jgi:hypothetical protein
MSTFFLGPDGGGGTVTFTTSDGAFDVAVTFANKLREGLRDPKISCLDLAAAISRKYDKLK